MPIEAKCVLHGDEGYGVVFFKQEDKGEPCRIMGTLKELSPGEHGFHIHQYGYEIEGCSSTGMCFNPREVVHGAPWDCPSKRHVGDLGNIKATSHGTAKIDITNKLVSLVGPESVIGRALVVHANRDDLGRGYDSASKENGNVGKALACGIIAFTRANIEDNFWQQNSVKPNLRLLKYLQR